VELGLHGGGLPQRLLDILVHSGFGVCRIVRCPSSLGCRTDVIHRLPHTQQGNNAVARIPQQDREAEEHAAGGHASEEETGEGGGGMMEEGGGK
jgi:hypothetical protein